MKKLKRFLFFSVAAILSLGFLLPCFVIHNNKKASAEDKPPVAVMDENFSKYVSVSTAGQQITSQNTKGVDTNEDGIIDTAYIFVNSTATINLNWIKYGFYVNYAESSNPGYVGDNFVRHTQTLEFEKDSATNLIPNTFSVGEDNYRYSIETNSQTLEEYMRIQKVTGSQETTIARTDVGNLISYTKTDDEVTIEFTTGFTLKQTAPSTAFAFSVYEGGNSTSTQNYILNFERPILEFDKDGGLPIWFTCQGLDIGEDPYENDKLQRELSYKIINLAFTNNDYTELNPLYFNINYNGFIYTFSLYSKEVESEELLFVEYFDKNTVTHLATDLSTNPATKISKYDGLDFNKFSIDFNKPGRYEISVYDSTYTLGMNNSNFYTTSFYIKNENSSAFDNAYAILQTYDDEGNVLDYVVSEPIIADGYADTSNKIGVTVNNSVSISVKNLLHYFTKDDLIKNFTTSAENVQNVLPEGLDPNDLTIIEFIQSDPSGGSNIPKSTLYTKSELLTALQTNPDFVIECSEDAFYEIKIFRYAMTETTDGENHIKTYSISQTKSYHFTIVKRPKISYTVYVTNDDDEPIYGLDGKPTKQTYEADTPYVTREASYKINIRSSLSLSTSFQASDITLQKTYVNEYTITYAMQAVKIDLIEIKQGDGNNVLQQINFQFFGIGDISVEITRNGVTSNYTVKSEEVLSFKEYGTYYVKMTDSMGTSLAGTYPYKKPISISSVLLIGFVGLVVAGFALLFITSRGKMKTR